MKRGVLIANRPIFGRLRAPSCFAALDNVDPKWEWISLPVLPVGCAVFHLVFWTPTFSVFREEAHA